MDTTRKNTKKLSFVVLSLLAAQLMLPFFFVFPAVVNATQPVNLPTDQNQCKKGGHIDFTDSFGKTFENQGQCVSCVESNSQGHVCNIGSSTSSSSSSSESSESETSSSSSTSSEGNQSSDSSSSSSSSESSESSATSSSSSSESSSSSSSSTTPTVSSSSSSSSESSASTVSSVTSSSTSSASSTSSVSSVSSSSSVSSASSSSSASSESSSSSSSTESSSSSSSVSSSSSSSSATSTVSSSSTSSAPSAPINNPITTNPIIAGNTLGATDEIEEEVVEVTPSVLGAGTLTCEQAFGLSGVVFIDSNGNSVLDGNEVGVSDVRIELAYRNLDGNFVLFEIETTDVNGEWTTDVCPATYRVRLIQDSLPNNTELVGSEEQLVTVGTSDVSGLAFALTAIGATFNWLPLLIVLLILAAILATIYYNRRRREAP